jgi:chemotaxis protein methyltransferase CheR
MGWCDERGPRQDRPERAEALIRDQTCVAFLQWCLPQLGLRWSGYRKVRRLITKRLNRRLVELGLADLDAYRSLLLREPGEWARLEAMCHIPISRFYRDRHVFDAISGQILPDAARTAISRGDNTIRCWSAGCASGEEPYTLALLWQFTAASHWPTVAFSVIATDVDDIMLQRAETACYAKSSLKDVPQEWLLVAFVRSGRLMCLLPEFRRSVRLVMQDIRRSMPDGPFDLILCRNLVFTYFDDPLQRRLLKQIIDRLAPRGFLVLGAHEKSPDGDVSLSAVLPGLPIYRPSSRT